MKYKKKLLALSLWLYPFSVFTVLSLVLSRRKKAALLLCGLMIYFFVLIFIPSESRVEIKADDWEYIYSGGIGVNDFDYNSKESTTATTYTETSYERTSFEEPKKTVQLENEAEPGNIENYEEHTNTKVSAKKSTRIKTTKPKTTKTKTSKIKTTITTITSKKTENTSAINTETPQNTIIYLKDDSRVYSNNTYSYIHTDYTCKNLKGTIIIMTFKQAVNKGIPYCPECASCVLYVPEEEELITEYE